MHRIKVTYYFILEVYIYILRMKFNDIFRFEIIIISELGKMDNVVSFNDHKNVTASYLRSGGMTI